MRRSVGNVRGKTLERVKGAKFARWLAAAVATRVPH
jgi:hypothetical protein